MLYTREKTNTFLLRSKKGFFLNIWHFFWIKKSETDEDGPKDIDLRTELLPSIAANTNSTLNNDPKKRLSEEPTTEEPSLKKTKAEKLDM